MCPQHLKDMQNHYKGESSPFMSSLAAICLLVLESRVQEEMCPLFYGASLTALDKICGGVHPIAVGCTLRHLVAKTAASGVIVDMSTLLSPRQLGYGVRGGAETAIHATRKFLQNLKMDMPW